MKRLEELKISPTPWNCDIENGDTVCDSVGYNVCCTDGDSKLQGAGGREMKTKARIIIEYNGKRYRVGDSSACDSKRACSLYERGVCDCEDVADKLPCETIADAFIGIGAGVPSRCYKEIMAKGAENGSK